MSIKIGDIDVAGEIVELHFQVIRLQLILDKLVEAQPAALMSIRPALPQIEQKALELLQKKFPNMGIQKK